ERHRTTEDLADRVEKIDLLITLRQLIRRVLDFQCRLQKLRHHWHHEPHVAVEIGVWHTTRTELQPGATWSRHGRHQHTFLAGIYLANSVRQRGKVGKRWRPVGARVLHKLSVRSPRPHGGIALRRGVKRRQDSREVGHCRIMIRRTVFPRAPSNRSTLSMSCRIKNNPRPSSRSTLAGVVGSLVHRSRSKPSPSSCTSMTSCPGSTRAITCTCFAGSSLLPRRMALDSASVSATARFSIN